MTTMKAAVMYGPNDIRVEQVEKPSCKEDGMIVQIKAVGLCGSDIRNLTTDSRSGRYPWVYGHEHSGIISEIGPMVKTNFKVGDRIYISPILALDPSEPENPGGFAEYMAVPAWCMNKINIVSLPEDVKYEDVTLADPLTSVYACQDAIDVKIGQTVVIIGAGPIGCFHSELAKMRGASKVIMVEIKEERLKMSLNFGVDHTINSTKVDPIKAVKELTGGKGADRVISANPSVESQQQAVYMCARGGIVTLFGGVPKGALTEFDTNYIHYAGMWLYGHIGGSKEDNMRAFELICSGQFNVAKYISRIMPLDGINEALELAKAGKVNKIVFNP